MKDMENRNNHKNQKTVKTDKTVKTASAIFSESLKCLKNLMQIFVESAKPIFATSATANFVGKASCESTMRYGVRSRIPSFLFRYSLDSHLSRSRSACAPRTPSLFKDKSQLSFPSLVSLICLCMLTVGVGEVWGETATLTISEYASANSWSNSSKYSTAVVSPITFTGSGGTNSTKYYSNDNTWRFYSSDSPVGRITITTTSAYKITAISSSPSKTWTKTSDTEWYHQVSSNTSFTSITVTYSAAAPATPHTVRFYTASGIYSDIEEASAGAGVTPPVMSTPCDGWAFQGWSKSQSTSSTSTTELTTVTLSGGKYYPSSDVTLYPVYTKTGDIGFTKYEKVASAPSDWSGKYLLSTGAHTATGYDNSNHLSCTSLTPGTTEYDDYEFTLTKVGTVGYAIQEPGGEYIGWSDGTAFVKQATLPTTSNTSYLWTPSVNSYIANVSTNTRKIGRKDNTQYDFRPYSSPSSSTYPIVYLYKRIESATTYYYSYPNCCTPLGTINGSVSWSNGQATVSWDKLSNVDGTTPYAVSVLPSAGVTVNSIDLTGAKATCSVTGLTAGTAYTFTINAYGDASHCDKNQAIPSTAPQITVKSAPVALTGSDYAEGVSGGGTVKTFIVSGVGLTGALTFTAPTNFQVSTDNGSTWSTDGGTKTLAASGTLAETTIKVRLVEGLSEGSYGGATTYVTISGGGAAAVNSSVSITGTVSSACSVPTIGNPTLTSITSSTITVSCPTISGGTNCDVDDYGFIWKAGSAPMMASYDGKKKTGENNQSTAYNDGLSIDVANNTGTTYYIKAYAHNSAGNNVSSTALQVIPQSVTFVSNGGSSVATAYVNNGGTVSKPSNPTRTHYTFDDWYTDNGVWASKVNFSGAITENKTYFAHWEPVSYTITASGLTNVAPTTAFPSSFTYTGSATTYLNRTLSVDEDNFFLPDALTVTMGGATLTAGEDYSYDNKTGAFTFDVAVIGNVVITATAIEKLKSIAITTDPTKKVYFAGEAFSNTGAVVTATMGDETTKAVSGSAVWTPSGALTAEASKTMTATYTERGISKTATTTVDVYSVTVDKVNEDGDAISADGVTATWTVGTKAIAAGIGSTNYVFKEWAFVGSNNGLSISSTTSANTTITGTPTGNVTIKAVFYKPVAVTWTVNGESYDEGSPTDYVKRGTQWKDLTLPDAPDDDALESGCDVDKFMGWTNMAEHWVGVTHDDAPTVCLKSFSGVTTVINDPIEFKAVFAKEEAGDDATLTLNYATFGSDGYASTNFTVDGVTFARSQWGGGSYSSSYYIQGKTNNGMYNSTAIPGAIKSVEIDKYGGTGNFYVGTSSNPSTNETAISDGTTNFSTSNNYQYIKFYSTGTVQITSVIITYVPVEYSDYITLCSSTNITISDPSITGEGEITFDQESPVATCLEAQTIIATVTPASGYECTALSFTGGSVNVSPTIADVLPLTEETEFTLSFAKDADGTLATSATFSPKAVTDWTWTYGGEAIPNPVNLYVGEKARFDVTYEPSDVITAKKTYTRTKVDVYINWVGDVYANYFYCSGKASTGESTTTVTVTHADSPTQNIYIKVKPLPTVTFVDNVHNLTDFTNWGTDGVVASTASSGVITHTKVTPSHDNIDEPGTGNTCEKQHLHLVGWIRSDYDKVADYMDGTTSDKPTESEILGAGTDGKGLEYFFAPNASINIETYNGLTFYAVWALVE